MCECGRARLGRAGDISSLLSVRYRGRAQCPMRFLFPIFKIYAIATLGSPEGRERGRKARRAWVAGRLVRSRRGSILVARPRGGASSRVESERKAARNIHTGVRDNSLIILDFRKENGFGFRSVQLGFPSAWAWNSFSPVWNSFSPAWNSFRARAGRADPGAAFRPQRERGDRLPDGERAPAIVPLGSYFVEEICVLPPKAGRRYRRSRRALEEARRRPAK